jgi:2'-5' RNA ligase
VAYAITLRLDEATAARIETMLLALPDRRPDIRHSYPPHITLAVYGANVDAADLDAALATATDNWERLFITLAGIGIFPADAPTIWLVPVPTVELLRRHAILHAALADLACHPHYEVGAWMPHVTLTTTKLLADSVEVVTSMWTGPISGTLDCLDLVRLHPVEVLSSRPLRS